MSSDEIFKATLIVLEIGIMEPRAQINGGVGIFDLEGFGLNHTIHMSPSLAQKMIAVMVVSNCKMIDLTLNIFSFILYFIDVTSLPNNSNSYC